MDGVEIQIQFQDIHARFTKESQVAALGMLLGKRAHVFIFHSAFPGNARYLEFRRRGRNFGIQTRAGSSHQIYWNGHPWILSLQFSDITFYAIE